MYVCMYVCVHVNRVSVYVCVHAYELVTQGSA